MENISFEAESIISRRPMCDHLGPITDILPPNINQQRSHIDQIKPSAACILPISIGKGPTCTEPPCRSTNSSTQAETAPQNTRKKRLSLLLRIATTTFCSVFTNSHRKR